MRVLRPGRTALDVTRLHGFAAGLVLADASLLLGMANHSDRVIDRIVRQSRVASDVYGVPPLVPQTSVAR